MPPSNVRRLSDDSVSAAFKEGRLGSVLSWDSLPSNGKYYFYIDFPISASRDSFSIREAKVSLAGTSCAINIYKETIPVSYGTLLELSPKNGLVAYNSDILFYENVAVPVLDPANIVDRLFLAADSSGNAISAASEGGSQIANVFSKDTQLLVEIVNLKNNAGEFSFNLTFEEA